MVVLALGCARGTPAQSPENVPSSRCPFGNTSYDNGERVCDHGRELECRERIQLSNPGWYPTGKSCMPGEPAATSS
jgi:hypothetical protein